MINGKQFWSKVISWSDFHRWWAPFVRWSPMLFRWLSDALESQYGMVGMMLFCWLFIWINMNIAVENDGICLQILILLEGVIFIRKKLAFIIGRKTFCFSQLRPKLAEEVRPLLFFGQFHVNSPKFSRQTVGFVQKSSSDCGNFLYGFFTGAKLIFYPGGRLISLLFALKWSLNLH